MREKIITAICRTVDGVEWTSLKVGQGERGLHRQETLPKAESTENLEIPPDIIELPKTVVEQINGHVIVPLRTAELLMRTMEFPAVDEGEIADMARLQADKISPFPSDQIAVSYEILQQNETTSVVLIATAKRSCIDAIGDSFSRCGVNIQSIDSRLMGWLQLLQNAQHIASEGCEIIVLDDGIDFSLVTIHDRIPIAFRILHKENDNENLADELAQEIEYVLSSLDVERDLPAPSALHVWCWDDPSPLLRIQLAQKINFTILHHNLGDLPPLSEGLIQRAQSGRHRIELIPREWIEHKNREQMRRKGLTAATVIIGLWLIVMLSFYGVYKTREVQLNEVQKRAASISPMATKALENHSKLKTLKVYTDRTDSALECLLEVTRLLPIGDIEFSSYKYDKNKGVTLRGTSDLSEQVDNYFVALANSKMFRQISDQSISTTTTRGERRAVFTATLTLPEAEEHQ